MLFSLYLTDPISNNLWMYDNECFGSSFIAIEMAEILSAIVPEFNSLLNHY